MQITDAKPKNKFVPEAPEYLRSLARREAPRIMQFGWRPSQQDLAHLRASTRDPIAYLTMARAWRAAGFPIKAIGRLARGRSHPRRGPHGRH